MNTPDSSPTGPTGPPRRRRGVRSGLAALRETLRGGGPGRTPGSGTAGSHRHAAEFTGADGRPVPHSVSLPAGYHDDDRDHPVLYVLHGRGDTHASFLPQAERLRAAVEDGVLEDVVLVTPDSALDGRWEGRHATAFLDELVPHVERTHRVRPGPEHRLLVGWSMGGHGAFRFALEHPAAFAAVWSVDGAVSRDPGSYGVPDGTRPQLRAVGGDRNGDRVEAVVDRLAERGLVVPHRRRPLAHEFGLFVDADRAEGWPTLRWMAGRLGRTP